MGLFSNLLVSTGLKRREVYNPDVDGMFSPEEFVNEIMGVTGKRETYTRADGTKGTRFVATGATEGQKAFIKNLTEELQKTVSNVAELSSMQLAVNDEGFEPVISSLRQERKAAREDAFKQASRLSEEKLARRGLENSTASQEMRAELGSKLVQQAVNDERELIAIGEDLRNSYMNRLSQGFNVLGREREVLSNAGVNERASSINLATGQQKLKLEAAKDSFYDRIGANQQQANNFRDTLASAFGLGMDYKNKTGFWKPKKEEAKK